MQCLNEADVCASNRERDCYRHREECLQAIFRSKADTSQGSLHFVYYNHGRVHDPLAGKYSNNSIPMNRATRTFCGTSGKAKLMFLFFLRDYGYDFAWNFEEDVLFTGDWRDFFRHYERESADLLVHDF